MELGLREKVAVVTGASTGIGSDRASYSVGSTYFVDGGMLKTV
jgi:NADP-dependent 3-hydroxy acid dehydrogenase YdfG